MTNDWKVIIYSPYDELSDEKKEEVIRLFCKRGLSYEGAYGEPIEAEPEDISIPQNRARIVKISPV